MSLCGLAGGNERDLRSGLEQGLARGETDGI